jgi:hypothetical protein
VKTDDYKQVSGFCRGFLKFITEKNSKTGVVREFWLFETQAK